MNKNIIIIGAGGHGKVIADIIEKSGDTLIGYLDDSKIVDEIVYKQYRNLGNVSECIKLQESNKNVMFFIAIGNNQARKSIYKKYKLSYYTAIHPSAIIADDVTIGRGTAVMANVCINADTTIGENCIINTATVVEHENKIASHTHISSNVTLCGGVSIDECSYIGAGAIVKRLVTISKECAISEGTIVDTSR